MRKMGDPFTSLYGMTIGELLDEEDELSSKRILTHVDLTPHERDRLNKIHDWLTMHPTINLENDQGSTQKVETVPSIKPLGKA